MGKLCESLKEYFENTPKEVIDKDWKKNKASKRDWSRCY